MTLAASIVKVTEVDQQLADEDDFLGGEHGAEELGLGARKRNIALHLREPMKQAPVEEEHPPPEHENLVAQLESTKLSSPRSGSGRITRARSVVSRR